jgi:dUTP pyrophosphatase
MTLPTLEHSPSAQALHKVGITQTQHHLTVDTTPTSDQQAEIKLLSQFAKIPTRATDGSAGYDLYSPRTVSIPPGERTTVPFDISITSPEGTYIQLHSRSGLAAKQSIDIKAGVIDGDYIGNIAAIIHNSGSETFNIHIGDKIAQMVFTNLTTPIIQPVDTIHTTQRGTQGFGSSDGQPDLQNTQQRTQQHAQPHSPTTDALKSTQVNTLDRQELTRDTASIRAQVHHLDTPQNQSASMSPQNLYLSLDPFDQTLTIQIPVKGEHPTLGMHLTQCPQHNRPQLTDMALGTPGSRLPKWQSLLRHTYLTTFQDHPIHNIKDLEDTVQKARQEGLINATCTFAVDKSYGIHPQQDIPQLHFDQLNIIAKHIQSINHKCAQESTVRQLDSSTTTPSTSQSQTHEHPQSFTPSQLRKRPDWPEWQQAQYKMLNQYLAQGMFSDPQALPMNANALHMLWTYVLKVCGTRKAMMVCNGNTRPYLRKLPRCCQ